jgi:hypothetical protein
MLGLAIIIYFAGVVSVWICEFKRNALCKTMHQKVRLLEGSRVSMAVFHAKMYKIEEDCRREMLEIERVQQFILGNVLMTPISKLSMRKNGNELFQSNGTF